MPIPRYNHDPDEFYLDEEDNLVPAPLTEEVSLRSDSGYIVVIGEPEQAYWYAANQLVTIVGVGIETIYCGLTLDEAHATLTEGKTKAELVALGADFGLSLSESSLKDELLNAIRAYLTTLAG